jgi:predicted DNA-binding transcriptional regulator AlpA
MNEPLDNVNDLAKKLNISPSWIYNKTRQKGPNTIPVIRVGRYCRFRPSEVLDWLQKRQKNR